MLQVHGYEAHSDYLRCLQVHPTQPYLISSSGMYYINNLPGRNKCKQGLWEEPLVNDLAIDLFLRT